MSLKLGLAVCSSPNTGFDVWLPLMDGLAVWLGIPPNCAIQGELEMKMRKML
jgi:hypothetical protein